MGSNNRGIHFKKLWHKVAVVYSLIIILFFTIFFFCFERTLVDYFEGEQVSQYERALKRFEPLMESREDYSLLEDYVKEDEVLKSYEILIYGEDNNLLMGDIKFQPLLSGDTTNTKISTGRIVDMAAENGETDYWIFKNKVGKKIVYFIKDINELSNFYMKASSFIAIFALGLSILFILLSLITSRWLLKPIFRIVKKEEELNLRSGEGLLEDDYSEEELKRIVEMKNRSIIKVREYVAREKKFIANASHEMLTPVTVIKGYGEVLRWGREDEEVFNSALDSIDSECERMEKLMNALLFLSKIDGSEGPSFSSLDLEELVCNEVERRRRVSNRKIEVKSESVTISGSEELLSHLIGELIKNAIKYSSGEIRIEVSKKRSTGVLTVEDRGRGIAPEYLSELFNRFFQGENSNPSDGFGLGLSIVKEIAELHRGRITIKSKVNYGTKVTVEIPIL